MTRWLLLGLLVLGVAGCNYTEVEREIGYKGRARVNPWLAAERFVAHGGRPVQSKVAWTEPQPADALWLMPASLLGNEVFTRRMEDWMLEGGHLVLVIEYADAQTSDWSRSAPPPVIEPPLRAMLARHGLELRDDFKRRSSKASDAADAEKGDLTAKDFTADAIEFDDETFEVQAASRMTVAAEGGEPAVFASVEAGNGRLTVLTDGRLFRNRWIDQADHAALLDALVQAAPGRGWIGFMRGSGVSLWALLQRHMWPVLVAGALWLGLWLWKNLRRFGPLEAAAPLPVERGFGHHLEALGEFQWRLDHGLAFIARLQAQVVDAGQRLNLRSGQHAADLPQWLAERTKLPRERVARALAATAPADPAALLRITADLQQLLKNLHTPT